MNHSLNNSLLTGATLAPTSALDEFRNAIRAAGLTPPDNIVVGHLQRFSSNGKPSDTAGWYVYHDSPVPFGIFGDWRHGSDWVNKWRREQDRPLTPAEKAAYREQHAAARKSYEAEKARAHQDAARKAEAMWREAGAAPDDHPYLLAKQIKAHGARLVGASLAIPMIQGGAVTSLQFIPPDGKNKRFLAGGRVSGSSYLIGSTAGGAALAICEGFATGATIHEATGYPVAVAFNAGNLTAVAAAMRAQFPDLPLLICADDDAHNPDNPGLTKASEAARAVGACLAVPTFGTSPRPGATDFNDMAALRGREAVAAVIETALRTPTTSPLETSRAEAYTGESAQVVSLRRGSEIRPTPVGWLWKHWLATGKMHMFGGVAGTGKTTIAMQLAATVTTGGRWPDGTLSPSGNVAIWSGEDDAADTLVPRLMLSGADLSRIYFIDTVFVGGEQRAFDPARDMEALRRKLAEVGDVRLLIVDPIVSAVAGDSHKNAEVRRALQPLADLAASTGCAVLGITHFSKGTSGRDPVERLTGSLAFGALARVVLVAAKYQDDDDDGRKTRLFCRAKSNIGPDDGGFEFDLHQSEVKGGPSGVFASAVQWGNAVDGPARELLAPADAGTNDDGATADARRFLADLLRDGPMVAAKVLKEADGAGFSRSSIHRASKNLKIDHRKDGMRGGWIWRLPLAAAEKKLEDFTEDSEDAKQERPKSSEPSDGDMEALI